MGNKAPFHNKKNNVADAAILFSADEYLSGLLFRNESNAIFVSNNITDFTDVKSKDDFHPQIKAALTNPAITYQRVLPAALNLSKEIIKDLEEHYIQENYRATIYFECMNDDCHASESFTPFGYLDKTMNVKDHYEFLDPNQLSLFPDILIKPREQQIRYGECVLCGTLHLDCPICDEVIPVLESDLPFTCDHCESNLEIHDYNKENPVLVVLEDEDEFVQ